MRDYVIMPKEDYCNICEAVRTKCGKADPLKSCDIPVEIENLESGGGASFNIHYGVNPPDDTSMLWVETESEPTKTTITADFNTDKVLEQLSGNLPEAIDGASVAVIGKKVYLVSPYQRTVTTTKAIIEYDTETNTTKTLPVTLPHNKMTACAVGAKIYLFGGMYTNEIYLFDPSDNSLEKLNATLIENCYGLHAVSIGTKIYLLGGSIQASPYSSNRIMEFDTENNSLRELTAKLPSNLYGGACVAHGTTIYIFGGNYNENTPRANIYVFDTVEEQSSTLGAVLPTGSAFKGYGKIGNKAYLFGGYTKTMGNMTNDILEFNFETFEINSLTETMPNVRCYISSASVDNSIFLIGGRTYLGGTKYLNETLIFELASVLANGECVVVMSIGGKAIELMKGTNVLSVGVSQTVIGNESNEGEFVKIYAHNGTTWEEI